MFRKRMRLFQLFKKSVFGPDFYSSLGKKPISFSIKYYYSLTIALALVLTAVASYQLIPTVTVFIKDAGQELFGNFPDELVITVKDGSASVNVIEPYAIPLPESSRLRGYFAEGESPRNLLAIDIKSDPSPETVLQYDTAVLITEKYILYRGSEAGSVSSQSFDAFSDIRIDKALVRRVHERLDGVGRFVVPLVVMASFIYFLVRFTLILAYLFIVALLIMLLGRVKGITLGYFHAYRIAVHAASLPLAINAVIFGSYHGLSIPYLFTIILLIVAWFNLFPPAETEAVAVPSVQPR